MRAAVGSLFFSIVPLTNCSYTTELVVRCIPEFDSTRIARPLHNSSFPMSAAFHDGCLLICKTALGNGVRPTIAPSAGLSRRSRPAYLGAICAAARGDLFRPPPPGGTPMAREKQRAFLDFHSLTGDGYADPRRVPPTRTVVSKLTPTLRPWELRLALDLADRHITRRDAPDLNNRTSATLRRKA
jgi:hypothetical protein